MTGDVELCPPNVAPTSILVMMGVTGCGKSTIGEALAKRMDWPFKEGDDLHPSANVEKMRAGVALNDADRAPWLLAVADWLDRWRRVQSPGVISCSALKRAYRDRLDVGRPEVTFVYLAGDPATLAERLAARRGHFMPSSLLQSQLAALEVPARDEPAITVTIGASVDAEVETIIQRLTDAEHRFGALRGARS